MGPPIRPWVSVDEPWQAGDAAPQRSADLLERDVDNRHIELNDYSCRIARRFGQKSRELAWKPLQERPGNLGSGERLGRARAAAGAEHGTHDEATAEPASERRVNCGTRTESCLSLTVALLGAWLTVPFSSANLPRPASQLWKFRRFCKRSQVHNCACKHSGKYVISYFSKGFVVFRAKG
jgi:hypothetical protein